MKLRCALYKDPSWEFGGPLIFQVNVDSDGNELKASRGYARVSEIVEVEFPELGYAEAIAAQLETLDQAVQLIRDKAANDIAKIDERRRELLALPAPKA